MNKEQVKNDLRNLRKLTHRIESILQHKSNLERQINFLKERKGNESTIKQIETTLKSLNVINEIKCVTEIENRYFGAISKLEPMDKTIIIDGFLNGLPYWKIGQNVGYSERGVQQRILKILEIIACKF